MVKTYTQLLQVKYGDSLAGEARQYFDFILEGASRMSALINDLLAYSAVGRSDLRVVETNLNHVLFAAQANLREAISDAGAEVIAEPLPTVLGNEIQLIQVFQNLIGNALKFRAKQAPQIKIWAEKRDGEHVIAIQDNGIGIDPEQKDRIFVIFQRLHNRETYPGTGIGLAICKKVIERHVGKIWVESAPGNGSTFFFTLPTRSQ